MSTSDKGGSFTLPTGRRSLRRLSIVRERLGDTGVRDPDFPCRDFLPGAPPHKGPCESDGHYLCAECVYRDPSGYFAERQEPRR